jgi:bacterioferritin-associated ferredoxin
VVGCPGLAITLVNYRRNPDFPIVSIPYEFTRETLNEKDRITVLDTEGEALGEAEVLSVASMRSSDRTLVVQVQVPKEIAVRVAGIRVQEQQVTQPLDEFVAHIEDDTIICRCERVTAREIRELIRKGYRDMNEIKTVSRAGMGACGAKTCTNLIHRIFREEGLTRSDVTDQTKRPLFVEVPIGVFAGAIEETEDKNG